MVEWISHLHTKMGKKATGEVSVRFQTRVSVLTLQQYILKWRELTISAVSRSSCANMSKAGCFTLSEAQLEQYFDRIALARSERVYEVSALRHEEKVGVPPNAFEAPASSCAFREPHSALQLAQGNRSQTTTCIPQNYRSIRSRRILHGSTYTISHSNIISRIPLLHCRWPCCGCPWQMDWLVTSGESRYYWRHQILVRRRLW